MDLRQLKCITAIHDTGTLSGAASTLNIAPSAVSHHVSNLEASLGLSLFIRTPKGMRPTSAGARLYDHARAILRSIEDAKRDVQTSAQALSGRVSISMSHTAMRLIGPSFTKTIATKYPEVELALLESLSGLTVEDLRSRDVDLALAYNPTSPAGVRMTPLLNEQLGCIGHPKFFKAGQRSIPLATALTLPLLSIGIGSSARILFERADTMNKVRKASSMETDSPLLALELARAGEICFIGPQAVIPPAENKLSFRALTQPALSRSLYLCEDKDRPSTFLRDTVRQELISLIATTADRKEWPAKRLIQD